MRMFPATGPAGMVMGGSGGATAESFLLPLVLGISIVSFLLTATIVLSPTADEIRYDAALLDYIRRRNEEALDATPLIPRAAQIRLRDRTGRHVAGPGRGGLEKIG